VCTGLVSTQAQDISGHDRELLIAVGRIAVNAGTLELCVRALTNGLVAEDTRVGMQLTKDMSISKVIQHCRALVAFRLSDEPVLAGRIAEWLDCVRDATVERNRYIHGTWHQVYGGQFNIPSRTEASLGELRRGQMNSSVVPISAVHELADRMDDLIERAFGLVIRITAIFGPGTAAGARQDILAALDALEAKSEEQLADSGSAGG
jgi:hypothetical protein